jgi:MOSC domain-containing protein YiiM
MATVAGLFTSPGRKSGLSTPHDDVEAIPGLGLAGCAHANPPKREVLFASKQHLDDLELEPGVIRENVTVAGTDVEQWDVGQRVRVGAALFEVTMVCDPCYKMDELREGLRKELQGRRGMLARVVEGGRIAVGDEVALVDEPAISPAA